jgi:methionyl-tRNA formyltransferase
MKLRTVFFCGDQSPYGRAHLRPVLEHFDVVAVVIGTPQRWAIFREALSGVPAPTNAASLAARLAKRWRRATQRRRPDFVDVPGIARAAGVPIHDVFDVNDATFLGRLRALHPDVFVSAAYPQIFSPGLLAVAARGAVNFHPSLLPKFRGAHPHFWAIATGAATSGITSHYMTPRIDDGDVIAQAEFPIADLTYSRLYAKIVAETPALVRQTAAFLADGAAKPRPQDASQATQFRNDRDVHRRIFWRKHTAEQVRNLCRTERAFCFFRGEPLTPLDARVSPGNRNLTNGVAVDAGTVVDLPPDGGVVVHALGGCVTFHEVACARGTRQPADRWARRHRLHVGEMLN